MKLVKTLPRLHLIFRFAIVTIIVFSCGVAVRQQTPRLMSDGRYLLPNGWCLSPAGREINLGGLPLNIVPVPGTDLAVIASHGYSEHFIALADIMSEKVIDRQIIKSGWMGLSVSADGKKVYASAGGRNRIVIYNIEDQKLVQSGEITCPEGSFPAGTALSRENKYLFATGNHNDMLYKIDLSTNSIISSIKVGTTPYTCTLSPDSKTAYVSNWGENTVSVVDLSDDREIRKIIVRDHPNDLIINSDRNYLYVSCGNRNIVSVIDLATNIVIEEIEIALFPGSPPGSTPNALALSADKKTLYSANADNNCIAVIDVSTKGKSLPAGFIPTGWYPAAVSVSGDGRKIIVANGKGSVSHPSGDPKLGLQGESIHRVLEGTISFIDIPDKKQLREYSKQVFTNTPFRNNNNNIPVPPFKTGDNSPVKYVFYIIKENRTYDQIFGDMEIGNGDPDYCYFPEEVTPNHHALARTFSLFDNFYHNAEVSSDGHFWSTSAYATDYVEKFWPSSYSGQASPRLQVHDDSIAYPSSGFLWDLCAAKGLTYRSYGEFTRVWMPEGDEKYPALKTMQKTKLTWSPKDYELGMKIRPATASLEGHYNKDYAGADYISGMSDSTRFKIWVKEFRQYVKEGEMPKFTILSLPGDHCLGTRPGVQTPRAMMAENDLVLGKIVEEISKSPFWAETAIFVIEDDPQAGPDHVDCHRTVAFVISPYTKRGFVDNTMYSTAGMLRTMEEILGLPPLTQYDASATPMWNSFNPEPDLTPYTAQKNRISLNELNPGSAFGAQLSIDLPLDQADAAPDDLYNIILWKSIMGENRDVPPRRRASFIIVKEEDNETDED